MDFEDMGARIRKQRIRKGMTQAQLAKLIHVSTSFIGHLERGTRSAGLDTMVLLANTLNVGLDYLLAKSLTYSIVGKLPTDLTEMQKSTMSDILTALQEAISNWDISMQA